MVSAGKKLDPLDLKLLDCLQEDNLLTAEALAERVGRSPSAVARRLRQLRSRGAIAADRSVVSDEAAGRPLFVIVQLQLERHALNEVEAFRRQLVASEHVQLCCEVSGAFDMLLMVVAADMDAYNNFADGLLASHKAVRRYETSFVKKRLKASLALPLAHLAGRG